MTDSIERTLTDESSESAAMAPLPEVSDEETVASAEPASHSAEEPDGDSGVSAPPEEVPPQETPDPSAAPDGKAEKKPIPYAAAFLLRLGVTALALWLLLAFVVGVYVCHDNASFPMVKDGDLCLTFRPAAPKAGDAVVYRLDGETRFGRVVALAGDRVEFSGEVLLVNGGNVMIPAVYPTSSEGSAIGYPYTVPEDSVFILNDYRSNPDDSRTAGAVPLRDCRGSIFFLLRRRGI